jgi:molecular chaperone DnaK (HSP70)
LTLGGADIDHWLLDHFVTTQNIAASTVTQRLAERLKIQLSAQTQASEVYFDPENFESCEMKLDRNGFDEILRQQGFFDKLNGAMEQLLQQAQRQGIRPEAIDAVLLVGGTSQVPAVQTWVQQYFDPSIIRSDKPFEAIATGALQVGQNLEIQDFLYHGYGIRYWDRRLNAHNWHTIVRPGQPYPMTKPIELKLGASLDHQPKIELVIGELAEGLVQTEVYFEGDRLLTRTLKCEVPQVQTLNDSPEARGIAELDPPGKPGGDRIKVAFTVDRSRFLCITVEDLLTKRRLLEDQPVVQLS